MKTINSWCRLLWAILMTFTAIIYWIWPEPRHWWFLPLVVTLLAAELWGKVLRHRRHGP